MSASAALVSMHNAASQAGGDAFPVLKAFQDYLESERQRARHRMMTLSIVFAVVIVTVVGAFTLFWFSSMRGVQDTNRQLLEAALKRANEPPAPVVVQPPQPSAAETAKVIAEAVSKAQADQSAVFAKTLEGLNASLESLKRDNAEMQAEIQRAKAAAEKAEAERLAAEKAEAERLAAAKAAAEHAVAEEKARVAREEAEKAAAQKAAAAKAVAQKVAAQKAAVTGEGPASSGPQTASSEPQTGEGPASSGPQTASSEPQTGEGPASSGLQTAAAEPQPLVIPKYDAPPPPKGFSQDVMAVRLQKESRPISWRVYVPMRAE